MENYTSDSSDSDSEGNRVIDLAYFQLHTEAVDNNLEEYFNEKQRFLAIEKIILHHNQLQALPENLLRFSNTRILDISNIGLSLLPDVFCLPLTVLIAKNNALKNDSFPKNISKCHTLKELNLSGNHLFQFPEQILDFINLRYLYLGGNRMQQISKNIWKLKKYVTLICKYFNIVCHVILRLIKNIMLQSQTKKD